MDMVSPISFMKMQKDVLSVHYFALPLIPIFASMDVSLLQTWI
jgi:hypothetical protein